MAPISSQEIRVCHVCKINQERRTEDKPTNNSEDTQYVIGKPENVQKQLSVKFDSEKGQYSGLPTMWRELLEMPLGVSKDEVQTKDWDPSLGALMPSKKILFQLQEANSEN